MKCFPDSDSFSVPAIIDAINVYREKEGLYPLTYDSESQDFANTRAAELVASFSHTRPDGSSWLKEASKLGLYAENIAWTYEDAEGVVADWMASDGHRRNMMDPSYTKAVAAKNESYYVLLPGY